MINIKNGYPSLTSDMVIRELQEKKSSYGNGYPSFADKFLWDKDIFDIFSTWNPLIDNENTIKILREKINNYMNKESNHFVYSNQLWNR